MKKIVLSLAGVMAAVAFAPEASAVPVFARQTGMACSACHFQHFPLLNGFGRAFKNGGFTMVGAQGKVEDHPEHGPGLDIPDRLNLGVLTSAYWQDEVGSAGGANKKDQARWGVPSSGGELSIFYGGRASEFAGFLSELGAAGSAGAAATGAAKLALLFPVGDMRAGLVAYTGGQGAAYGFETQNTGAADTHKLMGNSGPSKQHVAATYAGSYLGTRVDATGINLVANTSMGFVSVGKYGAVGPGTGSANDLPLTYARIVANLDLAGWDVGFGAQHFSGDMSNLAATVQNSYNANVIDVQAQGELAGMPAGLYVTYGTAPANNTGNTMAAGWSTLVKVNSMAQNDLAAKSLNIAGSLEFVHGATVQAALRSATLDVGAANTSLGNTSAQSYSDNAVMIGATYDLTQNIALGLNYTVQSGSAWDQYKTKNGKDAVGQTSTTFLLEALF